MKKMIFTALALALSACAHATTSTVGATGDAKSCISNPAQYALASSELQKIAQADQDDRKGDVNGVNWAVVSPRDLARRIRVAEIFAEGCFKTAQDYAAAAIVYQHGEAPDHFYQTFIWAKKAVELGDPEQKWLVAAGLDRYLTKSGQKQLFATQASKDAGNPCWCLEPIEPSFPNKARLEFVKPTQDIAHQIVWLKSMNTGHECKKDYCEHNLRATPRGTVAGFW